MPLRQPKCPSDIIEGLTPRSLTNDSLVATQNSKKSEG